MNYNEFLEKLYSTKRFGSTPNLLVVKEILKKFGNPQEKLKFIHIAGTNGKGSVSNYVASALISKGCKTGLFTSPYIDRFNERIKINNIDIDDGELANIGEEVFNKAEEFKNIIKQFDIITIIALIYFARNNCDYVVLEAGMGGKNDSTNVINPVVSVITAVDFDHMEVLGETINEISYEKSGIIKENTPVCCYPFIYSETKKIIEETAEKNKSQLIVSNSYKVKAIYKSGSRFLYKDNEYEISMLGPHQIQNACLAIDVLSVINVEYEYIKQGLKMMKLTGRMEQLSDNLYIDGGHNPNGALSIKETVKFHDFINPVFVISMLERKDIYEYIKVIGINEKLIITKVNEDCYNPEIVIKNINSVNCISMEFDDVFSYIEKNNDKTFIFCGSLYQISKIKTKFYKTR